jgi:hypothetical protein
MWRGEFNFFFSTSSALVFRHPHQSLWVATRRLYHSLRSFVMHDHSTLLLLILRTLKRPTTSSQRLSFRSTPSPSHALTLWPSIRRTSSPYGSYQTGSIPFKVEYRLVSIYRWRPGPGYPMTGFELEAVGTEAENILGRIVCMCLEPLPLGSGSGRVYPDSRGSSEAACTRVSTFDLIH